jgi:single-strand DNA-binding protein
MALPQIVGEFVVTGEPELRFRADGEGWAKIRGRANDRIKGDDGKWKNGPALFVDITVNQGALNLIESLSDQDTIIVMGKLKQQEWEKDGVKRTSYEISASYVGLSTRWDSWGKKPRTEGSSGVSVVRDMLGGSDVAPF